MKSVAFCISISFLCALCLGAGYVFGGTNLSYLGYPEFSALKPTKPFEKDEFSFNRYKRAVQQYVGEAKEYTENARKDKERIDNAIEEAIDNANQAIDDFNRWARSDY